MQVWTFRDATLRGLDLGGFDVEAVDGLLGRVERTVSDATGAYLVVDVGSLAPLGGRALIPAGVVDDIDLDDERVLVRLTRDRVRRGPAYDWRVPIGDRQREELASYYTGRPDAAPRPARVTALAPVPATDDAADAPRTKAELYEEARRLGIAGRSKMSKAELARALDRRGVGARRAD